MIQQLVAVAENGLGLPQRPTVHYAEYVHPTPGISGPGPQRLVVGKGGEVYYTADHYKTFYQDRKVGEENGAIYIY